MWEPGRRDADAHLGGEVGVVLGGGERVEVADGVGSGTLDVVDLVLLLLLALLEVAPEALELFLFEDEQLLEAAVLLDLLVEELFALFVVAVDLLKLDLELADDVLELDFLFEEVAGVVLVGLLLLLAGDDEVVVVLLELREVALEAVLRLLQHLVLLHLHLQLGHVLRELLVLCAVLVRLRLHLLEVANGALALRG